MSFGQGFYSMNLFKSGSLTPKTTVALFSYQFSWKRRKLSLTIQLPDCTTHIISGEVGFNKSIVRKSQSLFLLLFLHWKFYFFHIYHWTTTMRWEGDTFPPQSSYVCPQQPPPWSRQGSWYRWRAALCQSSCTGTPSLSDSLSPLPSCQAGVMVRG